jgi:hypothetical protein
MAKEEDMTRPFSIKPFMTLKGREFGGYRLGRQAPKSSAILAFLAD